jgi:hypothetical protein
MPRMNRNPLKPPKKEEKAKKITRFTANLNSIENIPFIFLH